MYQNGIDHKTERIVLLDTKWNNEQLEGLYCFKAMYQNWIDHKTERIVLLNTKQNNEQLKGLYCFEPMYQNGIEHKTERIGHVTNQDLDYFVRWSYTRWI